MGDYDKYYNLHRFIEMYVYISRIVCLNRVGIGYLACFDLRLISAVPMTLILCNFINAVYDNIYYIYITLFPCEMYIVIR